MYQQYWYILSLMIYLIYLYNNLSGLGVDELLHLVMKLTNSSSEKRIHSIRYLFGILSETLMLIWQSWTILNNKWRGYQKLLISRQKQPLYLMTSTGESLHLLTVRIKDNILSFYFIFFHLPFIFSYFYGWVEDKEDKVWHHHMSHDMVTEVTHSHDAREQCRRCWIDDIITMHSTHNL